MSIFKRAAKKAPRHAAAPARTSTKPAPARAAAPAQARPNPAPRPAPEPAAPAQATIEVSVSVASSASDASVSQNRIEWSVESPNDLPEGLPFVNGRDYLRFHRTDPSLKDGEVASLYADSAAVKALTRTVAAAEDEQALLAQDNGLPRLATYFDNLWGLDPGDWFRGERTDIDNGHAAWLVRKPPTPTGRTPKYPYEVWFNAQEYGQVNLSSGTVSYRPDGSAGKMRMIYWRAGTMYDVRFEDGGGRLVPVKITRSDDGAKNVIWER